MNLGQGMKKGSRHSVETRHKLREASLRAWADPEIRRKMSEPNRSPERREKARETMRRLNADPNFEARRQAGLRAWLQRCWTLSGGEAP